MPLNTKTKLNQTKIEVLFTETKINKNEFPSKEFPSHSTSSSEFFICQSTSEDPFLISCETVELYFF